MNPDSPQTPREELEARLTALLLGELPDEDAAALREAIAHDPELAALQARLKQAVDLVRETAAHPLGATVGPPAPLRLSEERREKLLAHFKTIAPKEFATARRERKWLTPVSVAAGIAALASVAWLFLPALAKSKAKAQRVASLNNLKQVGMASREWGQDYNDSDSYSTSTLAEPQRLRALASDRAANQRKDSPPSMPARPVMSPPSPPTTTIVLPSGNDGSEILHEADKKSGELVVNNGAIHNTRESWGGPANIEDLNGGKQFVAGDVRALGENKDTFEDKLTKSGGIVLPSATDATSSDNGGSDVSGLRALFAGKDSDETTPVEFGNNTWQRGPDDATQKQLKSADDFELAGTTAALQHRYSFNTSSAGTSTEGTGAAVTAAATRAIAQSAAPQTSTATTEFKFYNGVLTDEEMKRRTAGADGTEINGIANLDMDANLANNLNQPNNPKPGEVYSVGVVGYINNTINSTAGDASGAGGPVGGRGGGGPGGAAIGGLAALASPPPPAATPAPEPVFRSVAGTLGLSESQPPATTTQSGYVDTSINWNKGTGDAPPPAYAFNTPGKQDGYNLDSVKTTLNKAEDQTDAVIVSGLRRQNTPPPAASASPSPYVTGTYYGTFDGSPNPASVPSQSPIRGFYDNNVTPTDQLAADRDEAKAVNLGDMPLEGQLLRKAEVNRQPVRTDDLGVSALSQTESSPSGVRLGLLSSAQLAENETPALKAAAEKELGNNVYLGRGISGDAIKAPASPSAGMVGYDNPGQFVPQASVPSGGTITAVLPLPNSRLAQEDKDTSFEGGQVRLRTVEQPAEKVPESLATQDVQQVIQDLYPAGNAVPPTQTAPLAQRRATVSQNLTAASSIQGQAQAAAEESMHRAGESGGGGSASVATVNAGGGVRGGGFRGGRGGPAAPVEVASVQSGTPVNGPTVNFQNSASAPAGGGRGRGFSGRGGAGGGGGGFGGGGGSRAQREYPNAASPGPVSVSVDPEGHSLVILTDDRAITNIQDLVNRLDAKTKEQLIEARVLESAKPVGQQPVDTNGAISTPRANDQALQQVGEVWNVPERARQLTPRPNAFNRVVSPQPVDTNGAISTSQANQLRASNRFYTQSNMVVAVNGTLAATKAPPMPVDQDVPVPRVPTAPLVPQPETQVSDNAFSTFSLNVSDVAYKLAAASLEKGRMPDAGSMRSEEFINAFDYRDPDPAPGAPIGFASELARDPFAHNRDLLRFAVKTAAAGRQPGRPLNITLLLDNSGSMERADRVAIMHEALRVLASQLQSQDRISIVTFARTARLWVDGIPGDQAGQTLDLVSSLTPEGGTDLSDALDLAYATAHRHYLANGVNRVVLLTDGAANLGNVDPETLKTGVDAERKQGIALDCFGVGWEGYNDDLLEVLTRNGDGRYGFINSPAEAATEFANELAGALHVAASDVKVQVEFNPKRVTSYRQIGYAKHQLTKEQFRDNSVHAAQIGAAEAGNALYTVEINPQGEGPVCTVHVRYRDPGTADYYEKAWDVPYTGGAKGLEDSSPAMRLAATAGAFSEWLAASPFAGEVTPDALLVYLGGVPEVYGADARPKQLEWMIRQAKSVAGK